MMAAEDSKGGFYKRDRLLELETAAQAKWDKLKIFEADAPEDQAEFDAHNKFMVTFPYPYMNGRLHLGHSFTLSKGEFCIGYQRLKGKRTLFPFGFHCTGMPIKACADKLAREIEMYGNPPVFPQEDAGSDASSMAKHSKVAAKTGGATYQWQIMQSMGLSDSEIAKFADPMYWLEYFPPAAMADLKRFGLKADWRRSFITTPANPYYDSFVQWQFNTLRAKDKLDFGKRHTIFSPKDGQPCMDHDRQTGEGVGPQEYTMIKLQVQEPYKGKLAELAGRKVFLVCGTLRPETMYGQTNCWVRPDMTYGAYEARDGEIFVCTEHCARNMAFQDLTPEFGKYTKLIDLMGMDIMGIPLTAPLTKYTTVYSLPMLSIKDNKGTGIVTSVPSDSPDDYAALRDLKNKPAFREKYGITDEMVMPYELIPIIDIPGYSDVAAVKACDEFKVKSQNDADQLAKAKELVYKLGFYDGILLLGEYAGAKVAEAKPKVRQLLVDQGWAAGYYEPEKDVMSRSGDKCVVALCDQWYLKYGEPAWRAEVEKRLASMECYSDETRHNFQKTLEWLHEWACSRSFGLGTKMPWAQEYLIESLSDSTIYMSYYTIAHLLHGGTLDGSGQSPLNIRPEQMTKEVWDFVFFDTPAPETDIPLESLERMRREFRYWYPVDLRVSGKDLISNHLTFFLYTHAAMWGEEMFPKSVRANGHLLINSAKMSKSTGNFKTLDDAIREFSADATRFALADAGDAVEDANFETNTVNAAILRLFTQYEWTKEVLSSLDTMRRGPPSTTHDKVFESAINKAIVAAESAYDRMMYREALKVGFYEVQAARDFYREVSETVNGDLLLRFIEVQALLLSPFCPHYTENIWDLLGKEGSILNARFPVAGPVDAQAAAAAEYFTSAVSDMRTKLKNYMTPKKNAKTAVEKPTRMDVYVTAEYPEWQQETLRLLERLSLEDPSAYGDNKAIMALLKDVPAVKAHMKKVMGFVQFTKDAETQHGRSALSSVIPFDEKEVLEEYKSYMQRSLELEVAIHDASAADEKIKSVCLPMKPVCTFA